MGFGGERHALDFDDVAEAARDVARTSALLGRAPTSYVDYVRDVVKQGHAPLPALRVHTCN